MSPSFAQTFPTAAPGAYTTNIGPSSPRINVFHPAIGRGPNLSAEKCHSAAPRANPFALVLVLVLDVFSCSNLRSTITRTKRKTVRLGALYLSFSFDTSVLACYSSGTIIRRTIIDLKP
jgi:hypothetical protein